MRIGISVDVEVFLFQVHQFCGFKTDLVQLLSLARGADQNCFQSLSFKQLKVNKLMACQKLSLCLYVYRNVLFVNSNMMHMLPTVHIIK